MKGRREAKERQGLRGQGDCKGEHKGTAIMRSHGNAFFPALFPARASCQNALFQDRMDMAPSCFLSLLYDATASYRVVFRTPSSLDGFLPQALVVAGRNRMQRVRYVIRPSLTFDSFQVPCEKEVARRNRESDTNGMSTTKKARCKSI